MFSSLEFLSTAEYSSLRVLAGFLVVAVLLGVLFQIGVLMWAVRAAFSGFQACVNGGFRLWRRYLSWMPWQVLLGLLVGFHLLRLIEFFHHPLITVITGFT